MHKLCRVPFMALCAAFLLLAACRDTGKPISDSSLKDADYPPIPSGQPLAERVAGVDSRMLDYLRAMDQRTDYTAHQPSSAERGQIRDWLMRLPEAERVVLDSRVLGVFIVDHFLGSAMADWLRPAKAGDYPQRFVLFINGDLLGRTMSEQLSARDASVFTPAPDGRSLRVVTSLADGSEPPAVMYALTHEGAHIWDYVQHATPKVDPALPADGTATGQGSDRPFTNGLWQDYGTPVAAADFPLRSRLHFYGLQDAQLDFSKVVELYDQLCDSPFPSLYASTSWAEDWAEMSVWSQVIQAGGSLRVELRDAKGGVEKTWFPLANPRFQARLKQALDSGILPGR
jgi:hypothetical protein